MEKFFSNKLFNFGFMFIVVGTICSIIAGNVPLIVFGVTSLIWLVPDRFMQVDLTNKCNRVKQQLQDVMEDRDRYHELYDTYWTKYNDKLKENLELAEKGSEQVKINLGLANENAELREQLAEANAKLAKYEHIDPEQEGE